MATATAPPTGSASASAALPSHWHVASSAAQWSDLNRQAAAAGVLLATIFVSDKALAAHAPFLERLRRAHSGAGSARFVFVHVGDGFEARAAAASRAPAATCTSRGPDSLATGRMSHVAAMFGLDVALAAALLPEGARGCPALLLTAGPAVDGGAIRWAATARVAEMTQLLGDWAYLNRLALGRKAAAAAASAAAAAAAVARAAARGAAPQAVRRQAVYAHA
ncbi:hypothetical protein TSOC_003184 [Tetrabaena socialis]|uniref:Uncharacterized protein n=1 Tax=Tetrabaena socialis TaxID=47790 RepID=A0A2J8AC94_9CHLO|nr:hypothetical protein TSOC_003184 [Tetrabaena socialis]|eukprot:PNH10127.1 hypothetical protein TSOC_003184 [Tetrabaena socialis]